MYSRSFLPSVVWMTMGVGVLEILRFALDDRGECRNPGFFLLEVSIRVQQVINWRDEVIVVVTACQVAGKGGEEGEVACRGADYQYTEHLAFLEFFVPLGAGLQVGLHGFGCLDAKRMRSVVERIGELFGKGDVLNMG